MATVKAAQNKKTVAPASVVRTNQNLGVLVETVLCQAQM